MAVDGGAVPWDIGREVRHAVEPRPDSGVVMCKRMASGYKPTAKDGPSSAITRGEYLGLRDTFNDSTDPAIREHGVAFADAVWSFMRRQDEDNVMAYVGPLMTAYIGLTGACAVYGFDLPPLSEQ